jgi:hypothetical protein
MVQVSKTELEEPVRVPTEIDDIAKQAESLD